MNKKILGIIIALIMLTALSPVYAQPTCTRVATYGGSFYNCTIEFVVGWNLISLPVVPFTGTQFSRTFNNTVKGIFGSDGLAQGTVVETYANGLWRVCAALTAGTCSGSLRNMVDGNGYWVYASGDLDDRFC